MLFSNNRAGAQPVSFASSRKRPYRNLASQAIDPPRRRSGDQTVVTTPPRWQLTNHLPLRDQAGSTAQESVLPEVIPAKREPRLTAPCLLNWPWAARRAR